LKNQINQINQALSKLFERHRLVFWYDEKQELREDFEALTLDDVQKIELKNQEFALKYRILREQPQQKFLLYREGAAPKDLDNWLLDIQLAHGEFRSDQAALWLSELNLGLEFSDLVNQHLEFFNSSKRREKLKDLLKTDDTASKIRLKMLAICSAAEPRLDLILEYLLQELAAGENEKISLCARTNLLPFLWQQLERNYGYTSSSPGLQDFVIELFKSCYAMATDGEVKLNLDALVFLKRWKDSRQFADSFEQLSAQCADILNIEQDLNPRDFRDVIELDYFRLIDQKIIIDLVKAVTTKTVTSSDVSTWIRYRKQGHWYQEFEDLYAAIDYAAQFIHTFTEINLTMTSLADGVQRYCQSWYRLDQLYRKVIFHSSKSGQASLMASLNEQIENLYSNNYLLKLNEQWQSFLDNLKKWQNLGITPQNRFFLTWVKPFLKKDKKVCVIISDALRYEIGDELVSLIRQEDRYEANLESALSMLPSYTQLGMAALLPNQDLEISDQGIVYVDNCSSQGIENRLKILQQAFQTQQKQLTAIKSEELMKLNKEDSRSLFKEHDVVYVYHNWIDRVGDKRDSEERAFEAVETTCKELILLIKKLTGANATNLIITSDHGFIYQHRAIDDSDFSVSEVEGEEILVKNRRFVIGKGLKETRGLRKFQAQELGLMGDIEIQIPKSINRLRIKGSGSRFVHGGATPQEVIIPVIKVNKKRASDLSVVEVDIIRGINTVITAGQLAVTFYQKQPVSDKIQPLILRAGIYSKTGELISDSLDLTFDLTSENPRDRELTIQFILTNNANNFNNQEVTLRLEEKLINTSHYKEYESLIYMLRRSFTSDFDF
jgi:uncharacterized protein (TIGR02687 family)